MRTRRFGISREWLVEKIREEVAVTLRARDRLLEMCATPYEDTVSLQGEVLETDIRHQRFQFWMDEGTGVSAMFTAGQEEIVTTALKNHSAVRIQVDGRAEFSADGKVQRITQVDLLRLVPSGQTDYDESAPAIEDVLLGISKEVAVEEWEQLPQDLGENLDQHIYGSSDSV